MSNVEPPQEAVCDSLGREPVVNKRKRRIIFYFHKPQQRLLARQYIMADEQTKQDSRARAERTLLLKARVCLLFIVAGLLLSISIVVFVQPQTAFFYRHFGPGTWVEDKLPFMAAWIAVLYESIHVTYSQYPVIAYCMDWLVFAHIPLLIFFAGAIIDPVRNIWIIKAGIVTCVVMVPFAFISGFIRGIPFYWLMLDSSFAFAGLLPLGLSYWYTQKAKRDARPNETCPPE